MSRYVQSEIFFLLRGNYTMTLFLYSFTETSSKQPIMTSTSWSMTLNCLLYSSVLKIIQKLSYFNYRLYFQCLACVLILNTLEFWNMSLFKKTKIWTVIISSHCARDINALSLHTVLMCISNDVFYDIFKQISFSLLYLLILSISYSGSSITRQDMMRNDSVKL